MTLRHALCAALLGFGTLLASPAPAADLEALAGQAQSAQTGDALLKVYREYQTLHDYFGRGGNDVMKRLKKIKEI